MKIATDRKATRKATPATPSPAPVKATKQATPAPNNAPVKGSKVAKLETATPATPNKALLALAAVSNAVSMLRNSGDIAKLRSGDKDKRANVISAARIIIASVGASARDGGGTDLAVSAIRASLKAALKVERLNADKVTLTDIISAASSIKAIRVKDVTPAKLEAANAYVAGVFPVIGKAVSAIATLTHGKVIVDGIGEMMPERVILCTVCGVAITPARVRRGMK